MKLLCDKCKIKTAVWQYMPNDIGNSFCDDCVSRGCSCNWIEEENKDATDKDGKLLPCCEYDYNEEGFEDEN